MEPKLAYLWEKGKRHDLIIIITNVSATLNNIDDERRQYGLTFSDGKTMMWTIMVMAMLKKDKMRRMIIITHGHGQNKKN